MGLYLRNFARPPRGHIPNDSLAAWINMNVLDNDFLLPVAAMFLECFDLSRVRFCEFRRKR